MRFKLLLLDAALEMAETVHTHVDVLTRLPTQWLWYFDLADGRENLCEVA